MSFESKYLKVFKTKRELADKVQLAPDNLFLVEVLKEPEIKTKSGLVLTSGNASLGHFEHTKAKYCVVLKTAYAADINQLRRRFVSEGDVVVIAKHAGVFISNLAVEGYIPNSVGVIHYDDILLNLGQLEDLKDGGWLNQLFKVE